MCSMFLHQWCPKAQVQLCGFQTVRLEGFAAGGFVDKPSNPEALIPAFEGVARWSETMSVALALPKHRTSRLQSSSVVL